MSERRRTDFEVLLSEGHQFACFVCGGARERLFRVRLQECPAGPYPLDQAPLYQIRRRLICGTCLGAFDYADAGAQAVFVSARATIAGREWLLRQHPFKKPPTYTRDEWTQYLTRTRTRRTH